MQLQKALRIVLVVLALLALSVRADDPHIHSFKPQAGFVPNEATAIRIAEAVWLPIYGVGIYDNKPFGAKLNGDSWVVEGTLPEYMHGGAPYAEISRIDGRIIRVSHGK
jgi:hypothetical protein